MSATQTHTETLPPGVDIRKAAAAAEETARRGQALGGRGAADMDTDEKLATARRQRPAGPTAQQLEQQRIQLATEFKKAQEDIKRQRDELDRQRSELKKEYKEAKEAKEPQTAEEYKAAAKALEEKARELKMKAAAKVPDEALSDQSAMATAMAQLSAALRVVEQRMTLGSKRAVGEIVYDETKSEHIEAAGRFTKNGATETSEDRSGNKAVKQFGTAERHIKHVRNYIDALARELKHTAIANNKERRDGGCLVDTRVDKDDSAAADAVSNRRKRTRIL